MTFMNSPSGARGEKGLSAQEAARLLKEHGQNIFRQGKKFSVARIFAAQFKDILIIILIVSTLLSLLMGELSEAAAIILIILLNAIMGFVQEYRTEKTLDALKNMAAPVARVLRDGKPRELPAAEVVPGDLLLLEAGDRVPSDAGLIEAADMQADESLLTGESLPVKKSAGAQGDGGRVFMGTMITRGRGKAVTHATGMKTEMGKIAGILSTIEDTDTPLQKRLAELGKYIAIGCLIVCGVVTVTGILRGEEVMNMIITGISLAVAAVPEGLPAIVTISLALGVGRMLKRNALIRRLPAVETLGCATVLCSDKTGTLTENRMTVRRVVTPSHAVDVEAGSAGSAFLCDGKKLNPASNLEVRLTLETGAICNNAHLLPGSTPRAEGDPTEGALLVCAQHGRVNVNALLKKARRIGELPFDSERKCMSVIAQEGGGRRLYLKGAPDIVIGKCNRAFVRGGEVSFGTEQKRAMIAANDGMADSALRVLALAYKDLPDGVQSPSAALEQGLVFLGLEGMMDPPRAEVCGAVRKCVRAGIKPVMITGDHKKTAAAVARELGILHGDALVVTGAELDTMSDEQLRRVVPKAAVFARVSPAHKLRIVKAFKKNGNVVAMTGDGVNDAPAVKEADIGVSMGQTGTDVTKEASSVILLDDNFASMVAAVEEGRVIYGNIRKFIRYLLSCNIGEVLTMFIGMLIGLPVVLTPIQILWVNLVTDGLPAIALGLEPPDDDVMERGPRGASESVFSNGLAAMMVFRGCVIGLCTLGAFITAYKTGGLVLARTSAFLTLVTVQLIHVFECKSETKNIFHIKFFNNPALVLAVLVSAVLMLAAIYIPALRVLFGTAALGLKDILWVLAYSAIGPLLSAIVFRNKRPHRLSRKQYIN
jgi:P-type Ca2+ transporter type 2C